MESHCYHCNQAEQKYENNLLSMVENDENPCFMVHTRSQSHQLESEHSQPTIVDTSCISENREVHENKTNLKNAHVANMQDNDPTLTIIKQWVRNKTRHSWSDIPSRHEDIAFYWIRFDSLFIQNDIF